MFTPGSAPSTAAAPSRSTWHSDTQSGCLPLKPWTCCAGDMLVKNYPVRSSQVTHVPLQQHAHQGLQMPSQSDNLNTLPPCTQLHDVEIARHNRLKPLFSLGVPTSPNQIPHLPPHRDERCNSNLVVDGRAPGVQGREALHLMPAITAGSCQ